VPTLVHDGQVIIESDDIIDYLDNMFPAQSLRPADKDRLETMYKWLRRATSIHLPAVKPYIYHKRVGKKMALAKGEDEKYKNLQTNPELKAFHEKSTTEGFSDEDIAIAVRILDECFSDMNEALKHSSWLAGDEFSLADIAWAPLHFTLDRMAGYDFRRFTEVSDWMQRLSARDSYRSGILDWWPAEMGGK
jgi:glutathione S-transferase